MPQRKGTRRRFPLGYWIPFFPWVLDHVQSGDVALFFHTLLFTAWRYGFVDIGPELALTPWLRLSALAERFGVRERTIRRWIQRCEGARLVRRQRVKGHESRFRVALPYATYMKLTYLSKTVKAQVRRWALRPRRARRKQVNPTVSLTRSTCTPVHAIRWYYEKVKAELGLLPPGSSGDPGLQFRKYLIRPGHNRTWTRDDYSEYYRVMGFIIQNWDAWKRERRREASKRRPKFPPYPPLGFVHGFWWDWKRLADAEE